MFTINVNKYVITNILTAFGLFAGGLVTWPVTFLTVTWTVTYRLTSRAQTYRQRIAAFATVGALLHLCNSRHALFYHHQHHHRRLGQPSSSFTLSSHIGIAWLPFFFFSVTILKSRRRNLHHHHQYYCHRQHHRFHQHRRHQHRPVIVPIINIIVPITIKVSLQRHRTHYPTSHTPNSKHWFTTSFHKPLPYLVTPWVPENCQLTSSFLLVLKQ